MKKGKITLKGIVLIIAVAVLLCGGAVATWALTRGGGVEKVATEDDYGYVNPDETKAEPDEGITIDGVLDEKEYQDNNWLYLHNDNGNSTVDIATTSYYGEKGMYFVYDVTESTPIYVNLDRTSAMNSCVELYLALSGVTNMDSSEIFEIDLLPTGDLVFKQRNGKGAFMDVATTDDKMAYLGATTKGGEINTEDCYGYCLEFFLPWEYLEFLGMDVEAMKTDYVFVNTAHITSYNYAGTAETDRYWQSFARQLGGNGWGNVSLYYRFNADGVMGAAPVDFVQGEHYTITGTKNVIPGTKTHVVITPEEGYALNSILVNGEEYIKKVSYKEDGSVVLDVRGVKEGLKISAAAEAVTDGNKTLSGTVAIHKAGGDNLSDVKISYNGPDGEKPIELDNNGKFKLKDLKQGYYTITVEKQGYDKIIRSIYLNRDIDTQLVLEYTMFEAESGICWILDDVNEGIIHKMGGFGSLLTMDSYENFSLEANLKYYEAVAKSLEEQDRQEQRQGLRIKFSNDKYWHIDLLYQKDKYFIQYAKATTNSIFNFRDIYTLSDEEIARFKSEEGISLKVVREGASAIIYLGDKLIAVEKLDDEYEDLTARIGFESWGPYTDVRTMEYRVSSDTEVDVKGLHFGYHKNWDVTKQFEGVVSQPNGGNTVWLRFYEKIADMDLTFKVLDNPLVDGDAPRTSIRFEFDNGETFIASICESNKGVVQIQNLKSTTNSKDYSAYYNFTEAEKKQYQTEEGMDFRVVRNGTEILFFLNGEYKAGVDLSEYIQKDTKAIVSIQHQDDKGVPYVMSYTMSEELDKVTVTTEIDNGIKSVKEKKEYIAGQKVVVEADEGYYIKQVTVNGKDDSANLKLHGAYEFTVTEKDCTIKAQAEKRVFGYSAKWNLLNQNLGTDENGATIGWVSLPEGGSGGGGGWLYFYEKYSDMDLTWRVLDHPDSDEDNIEAPRTIIRYQFENDETFIVSVCESNKGIIQIQNLKSTINTKDYSAYYNFTEAEKKQYQTEEGIDFRLIRNGTEVLFFIGDEYKASYDLSEFIEADTKMTVSVAHNDDKGVEIKMPFAVTDKVERVKITIEGDSGSKLVTDKESCVIGQTVVVSAQDGYYCTEISVDGEPVTLNPDGTVSFVATKDEHVIAGTVKEAIFKPADNWDLLEQNQSYVKDEENLTASGVISLPNGGKTDAWAEFYEKYVDVDLTLTLKDEPEVEGETRTTVKFKFANEANDTVYFSIVSQDGVLKFQTTPGTIHTKYTTHKTLSAAEKALYEADGIDFRIIRVGTKFLIYMQDGTDTASMNRIAEFDLSANIEATTQATVSIQREGDSGTNVDVPFAVTNDVKVATITIAEGNEFVLDSDLYLIGDDVKVSAKEGYYATSLLINGLNATMNPDGTTSFVASEAEYVIEGTVKEAIFKPADGWNLLEQNQSYVKDGDKLTASGVVSLPNGGAGGGDGWLYFYDKYTDIDLTISAKDDQTVSGNAPRTSIGFVFDDEEKTVISVSLTENGKGVVVQNYPYKDNSGVTLVNSSWTDHYILSTDEAAQYKDGGISLRVVRSGTNLVIYLEDVANEGVMKEAAYVDLSSYIDADTTATVRIRHDDDKDTEIAIPFEMTTDVVPTNITITADATYGTIALQNTHNFVGDKVIVNRTSYDKVALQHLAGVKVDGVVMNLDADATCSFVATKAEYSVEGIYRATIFTERSNSYWNLVQQNQGTDADGTTSGVVSIAGDIVSWLYLYEIDGAAQYGDVDLTFTLKDFGGTTDSWSQIKFAFRDANNAERVLQLTVSESNGTVTFKQEQHKTMTIGSQTICELDYTKYTGDGVDVRVKREGTKMQLYVDGVFQKNIDLSGYIENDSLARVGICHNGDKGKQVVIPYKLSFPEKESIVGKYVSILGDGISMVAGMPENSDNNSTTAINNATDIYGNTLDLGIGTDWTKIYWGKSLVTNDMKLLVNNSVSKGLLHANPHTSTYGNNASNLPKFVPGYQRAGALGADQGTLNGKTPDIIYIYMGTEDYKQSTPTEFATKYRATLDTITATYPNAEVFCFTVMRYCENSQRSNGGMSTNATNKMATVNNAIKTVVSEYENVTLVDISDIITADNFATYFPETGTYVAPKAEAHTIIAERLQKALESQFKAESYVTGNNTGNGTLTIEPEKDVYGIGDTVTIKATPESAKYYLDTLKIDGVAVTVSSDGTYTFTISKLSHTIESTFRKKIFTDNALWDLTQQNQGTDADGVTSGVITYTDIQNTTNWLYLYQEASGAKEYGDIDLTLNIRNYSDSIKNANTQVKFEFATNDNYWFRFVVEETSAGGVKVFRTGSFGNLSTKPDYEFSADEIAAYNSIEGIDMRVKREGTKFYLYIGGNLRVTLDESAKISSDTKTAVCILHDNDIDIAVSIPYEFLVPNTATVFKEDE